ncbi:MAG: hypothetical protein HQK76_07390 [Desulfobacterales bacterium]|nr:hypothetical protein [Desulfobacterales bacterium]
MLHSKKIFFQVFKISILFVIGLIGFISVIGTGGGSNEDETKPSVKAKWTYMLYMAGDNNLSDAAFGDINEMEEVGSTDNVNIVAQVEFSKQFSKNFPENTLRGKITKDNDIQKIGSSLADIGNKDMGNRDTLTNFINWAVSTYPAENYAIVMWDHGAGWKSKNNRIGGIRGACEDSTSGSFMSLPDIVYAFKQSGVRFGMVDFDACLMGMYEIAYEFSGVCDYMTFSEEVEPGEGNPYNTILQKLVNNPIMSSRELAKTTTSEFKAFYKAQARTYITKSSIDVSKSSQLHSDLSELARIMQSNISQERPNIQYSRDNSISYDYKENHDLGDFLQNLSHITNSSEIKNQINKINNTLATLIISNEVYSPNPNDLILGSTGLAIFLPRRDQITDEDLSNYARLSVNQTKSDNNWGSFINTLINGDTDAYENPLTPLERAPGNFVIWLEWDSDADLDLIVLEPDGNFAAPYIGSASPNGFLSEESSYSGVSAEYYAALEQVETGYYDIIVNYYEDGSSSSYPTTAYLYLLDPETGIYDFELQDQRTMDLTNPAPEDWVDDDQEFENVWNDLYSDWWIPGSFPRAKINISSGTIITKGDIKFKVEFKRLKKDRKTFKPSKEEVKKLKNQLKDKTLNIQR